MKTIAEETSIYEKFGYDSAIKTAEEEKQLIINWQNNKDKKAFDRLSSAFMPLIIKVAKKVLLNRKKAVFTIDDLIHEGYFGFCEALNRFDTSVDVRLATYVSSWIKSYVQQYVIRNCSPLATKYTSYIATMYFSPNNFVRKQDVGKNSNNKKFYEEQHEDVINSFKAATNTANEVIKYDEDVYNELFNVEEEIENQEQLKKIFTALESIHPRQKKVVIEHYLQEKNLPTIATENGCKRQVIENVRKDAIRNIQSIVKY